MNRILIATVCLLTLAGVAAAQEAYPLYGQTPSNAQIETTGQAGSYDSARSARSTVEAGNGGYDANVANSDNLSGR